MSSKKKKILFVGSFRKTAKDGSVGGQMFASKTIINSSLSDYVEWTLIDTTSDSNILAGLHIRMWKAFLRLIQFSYRIIFFKHEIVFIFVADGWSFWEKGLMSLIAKYLSNSKVILAPRSGIIINDINKGKSLYKFIQFVFRKTDIVVCQSKYWKELFQNCVPDVPGAKFVIIENMIDISLYGNLPVRDTKNTETVTILFNAWVKRDKGIFEFVEAIKLLRQDNLNFKAIVAGNGADFLQVKDEINASGLDNYIDLKGWVLDNKKIELLAESDIYVLPTYFDGFPNSLLEAMAAGKACIGTRVGAIPDMIEDNFSGLLIDKQNHIQLYEALKALIADSQKRYNMAVNARERIRRTNTLEKTVDKYKLLFSLNNKV